MWERIGPAGPLQPGTCLLIGMWTGPAGPLQQEACLKIGTGFASPVTLGLNIHASDANELMCWRVTHTFSGNDMSKVAKYEHTHTQGMRYLT